MPRKQTVHWSGLEALKVEFAKESSASLRERLNAVRAGVGRAGGGAKSIIKQILRERGEDPDA